MLGLDYSTEYYVEIPSGAIEDLDENRSFYNVYKGDPNKIMPLTWRFLYLSLKILNS